MGGGYVYGKCAIKAYHPDTYTSNDLNSTGPKKKNTWQAWGELSPRNKIIRTSKFEQRSKKKTGHVIQKKKKCTGHGSESVEKIKEK